MFGSSKSWGLNSTHLHGTHVPVQEPSTASIADMCAATRHVRFGPKADSCSAAKSRYSISSSAIVRKFGGILRLSALAVARLMTRSILLASSTGHIGGCLPFENPASVDA